MNPLHSLRAHPWTAFKLMLLGMIGIVLAILLRGFILIYRSPSHSTDRSHTVGRSEKFLKLDKNHIRSITQKNLFRPSLMPVRPKPKVRVRKPAPVPKISIHQKVAHLKMVGYLDEDQPQAVVEDGKQKKTHYVVQGEFIGEIEVRRVDSIGVDLFWNGESYKLRM